MCVSLSRLGGGIHPTTIPSPRGIEIQKARDPSVGYLAGAQTYFDSKIPPNLAESREFYRGIVQDFLAGRVERDINDSIFMSMDNIFIHSVHRAYRILGEAGFPEAEFNAYACQNHFIGQYDILESDATRRLSAVQSLQWSLKPREFDEHVWHTPPLLPPNNFPSKPYDFDIYPRLSVLAVRQDLKCRLSRNREPTCALQGLGYLRSLFFD